MSSSTDLKQQWDNLKVNIVPSEEVYPVKRVKFAKVVKEIDLLIRQGKWRHYRSWVQWDADRMPITFCFTCRYPTKPTKTVSPQGSLKKIQCPTCDLILFDARYD